MARSVDVKLGLNVAGFVAGVGQARASISGLGRDMASEATKSKAAFERIGKGMLSIGVAAGAGLGLAVKAAIDWESAFAGVRKTVDGTDAEIASLEKEMRNLARTLPATHAEIAGVAEAAGQLGIARQDIIPFTETMIALGETTNLTAEEAATSIAQLANVMGTSVDDVDNLGAALVDLGNNGASTEKDIIEMAQRIAGAGKVIGLTEADVLGFANALASVGIEAEAGGSAISRVMIDIEQMTREGGQDLATLARVAGVSSAEFKRSYGVDAARTIATVVEGFGRMRTSGEDLFGVLSDLGWDDIRVRNALLTLSGAGDLLHESLDRGARSWEENTALAEEAAKRYETTEAQITIAWNNIKDAAIDAGAVLLPVIASIAGAVADLAGWFNDLPEPVQTAFVALTGLVAVVGILGGAFLILTPKIAATTAAIQLLGTQAPRTAAALGVLGTATKAIGLLGIAIVGLKLGTDALAEAGPGLEKTTAALLSMSEIKMDELFDFGGIKGDLLGDISSLDQVIRRITAPDLIDRMNDFAFGMIALGQIDNPALKTARDGLKSIDEALVSLVSGGHADEARRAFVFLEQQFRANGASIEQLRELTPQYQEALKGVKAETALVADETRIAANHMSTLRDGMQTVTDTTAMTEEQIAALEETLKGMSEAIGGFVEPLGAYNDALASKEQAEKDAAIATAEATSDSSDSWEDYVKDVHVSVSDYLAELERQVQAQEDWEANMLRLSSRVSDAVLQQLARMGPEGAPLVAELVNASDAELAKMEDLFARDAEAATEAIAEEFLNAGPVLRLIARTMGQDTADAVAAELAAGKTDIQAVMDQYGIIIKAGVPVIDIKVNTADARAELNSFAAFLAAKKTQFTAGTVRLPSGQLVNVGQIGGADGGLVQGFASGGRINVGTGPRADDVLILASRGEFIINAEATKRHLELLKAINAGRPVRAYGYAMGGPVSAPPTSTTGASGRTVVMVGPNRELLDGLRYMEQRDKALARYSEV